MKKTTQIFAQEIKQKWGLDLVSEYTGAHGTVTFKCINEHTNVATATNLLARGYKCKQCLHGYEVISKVQWTQEMLNKLLALLKTHSTIETAKLLNTTVHAINNKLAELEISNSASRLSRLKLVEVLRLQNRELLSEFSASSTLVNVRCAEGHISTQQASNIISHNTGCPTCFKTKSSRAEIEILEFIKSIYSGWVETNDRSILDGKELDIVLPDLGLAIEYNGTYWHSEDKVGKNYHLNKTNSVESFGYQLIHIKDYDWVNKQEIVKSMLRSRLGINTKIYARKCVVKPIAFPGDFLDANHLQGKGQPTSNNFGLFYQGSLVAVGTFAKPRYDKDADLELIRYCSILNTNVVGGISKILSKIAGSIVSYASRDYSTGNAYTKVGFTLTRTTEPGLEYYKRDKKVSRYAAQSMSPEELSTYTKYYNSGNLVLHRRRTN